jgi:DNA-binding response OmpR family regulator
LADKVIGKILIIDSFTLFCDYLRDRLEDFGFEVVVSRNGFDGLIKMRNELPDLIIMDMYLPRVSGVDILKEKITLKNTVSIPVIICSNAISQAQMSSLQRYRVLKIIPKPIKIDMLFDSIAALFRVPLTFDHSPCLLDVHLNDDILFVEVSQGLNIEKLRLLSYKIEEIRELYQAAIIKVLLILSDIEITEESSGLVVTLLNNVLETTKAPHATTKVLTSVEPIKEMMSLRSEYSDIDIVGDFTEAIDSFGKIDIFDYGEKIDAIKKELLTKARLEKSDKESIELKFESENVMPEAVNPFQSEREFTVAVIDDDLSILEFMDTVLSQTGWKIHTYESGAGFVSALEKKNFNLVFLDLMMPEMNGFEVLAHLRHMNLAIPVIILTALSQKETVLKARKLGATSYITKPIKPDFIIRKAKEILEANF